MSECALYHKVLLSKTGPLRAWGDVSIAHRCTAARGSAFRRGVAISPLKPLQIDAMRFEGPAIVHAACMCVARDTWRAYTFRSSMETNNIIYLIACAICHIFNILLSIYYFQYIIPSNIFTFNVLFSVLYSIYYTILAYWRVVMERR